MSHICIIEDDAAIAEIGTGLSGDQRLYRIHCHRRRLRTEFDAKGIVRSDFVDLMLPQLDGFTLCRKLRERLDIPILMVTAKKEDIDKIRGLGLGADDYIVKPFSPSELVARVQAHIATYKRLKAPQEIQQDITVGAIRICPKSHRVFVQEQEINLKNKEYELLLFLVTNADTVFDRETLYERIWGMDALGDNATVAVHINRLREKLEEDPSHPKYIETVWGAGYRFHA